MFNHCLKCGASLKPTTEDGFKRYVCGSCGWMFYNNPRPCVTAIIVQDQQILFIRRTQPPGSGKWDFPGGFMEDGESPEQALVREVQEEIGTGLIINQLLGFYPDYYDAEALIPILNIVYTGQISGAPKQQSDEFDMLEWFPLSGLPEVYAFHTMKNILNDTRARLERVANDTA